MGGTIRVTGARRFPSRRDTRLAELLNRDAPPTQHDAAVSSVSLDQSAPRHLRTVRRGELDLELLYAWVGALLKARGEDL